MEPTLNMPLTAHDPITYGPTLGEHDVDMEVLMNLKVEGSDGSPPNRDWKKRASELQTITPLDPRNPNEQR